MGEWYIHAMEYYPVNRSEVLIDDMDGSQGR
jgi:hypothetical protein